MTRYIFTIIFIGLLTMSAYSQTTEFTYQGSLRDGASVANGTYDFEFKLFDLVSAGAQQGGTLQRLNVAVANGIFTVTLDFGENFPGANRFLDIQTRQAGGGAFTPLTPRQQINSAPHAVKSLIADGADNANRLGGVAANQYVQTNDVRLNDSRPPTAGSANYIQNGTSPQASSNFNISGTGTANIINAITQYNLNGSRILSYPGLNNMFVGASAGNGNTTGNNNSFFGSLAGFLNTTGFGNSFFGSGAGFFNTGGVDNSFFGQDAGRGNTGGFSNSFFGSDAGRANTTGSQNVFVGSGAGRANTIGFNNSFFGYNAGDSNTAGNTNAFFGHF